MTFDPHEVIRLHFDVIHEFYKGKIATIKFRADDGTFTTYGGTGKTDTDRTVNIIINPVSNPKMWGMEALMGKSKLDTIIWDGFDTEMLDQFFESNNFDNIWVLIDEVYYRAIEIKSPESIKTSVPYWYVLLEKGQHRSSA
mgnify:CR=1 FL=1